MEPQQRLKRQRGAAVEEQPRETTKLVVEKMLRERRSIRLPVLAAATTAALLSAYMALHFGSRKPKFERMGPGYTPPPVTQPASLPPAALPASTGPLGRKGAFVDLTIPGAGAKLFVDGHITPVRPRFSMPLSPGQHIFILQHQGRTVVRRLFVGDAGAQQVDFTAAP